MSEKTDALKQIAEALEGIKVYGDANYQVVLGKIEKSLAEISESLKTIAEKI